MKSLFKSSFSFGVSNALLALAFVLSACAKPSGSSSASTTTAPSLSYATNPISFAVGIAGIDALTVNGSAKTLSISPALPDGLSFDPQTGDISGTATTITPAATYVVTGTNSYGSNFVALLLAVNDGLPTISYGGSTTLAYTIDATITPITPTLGGGTTLSCTSTPPLPAGLSLSSQCVLSGTPTQLTPENTYSISAQNSGGAASLSFHITVQDTAPLISFSPNTLSLSRGISMSAATPSNLGGAVVSCTISPTLPAGLSLSSSCQISGTPTIVSSSSAYSITATNSGGSSSTTIDIGVLDALPIIAFSPSAVTLQKNSALNPAITPTNTGGVINSCSVAPSLPAGLSVSTSNCQVSGTPTGVSPSTLYTFSATNGAGTAQAQLTLTVIDLAPVIHYSGSPYTFANLAAITPITPLNTGGAVVGCNVAPALPAGLILSPVCTISGTPSSASATASYVVTATNTGGTSQQTISITVTQVAPIIAYSSNTYTFNKTVPITPQAVTDTGGPVVSCSVFPTLPTGLSFSTTTCTISGIPTVAVVAATYTVTATNSAGSSNEALSVTVTDSPPAFTYPGSPYVLTLNQTISTITPSSTGGVITSCTSSSALPAGLALSALCGISGTPTAITAATSFTITGSNAAGSSTATIKFSVIDRAPVISYAGSPYSFPQNTAITAQTPSNTGGTIVSCTVTPALPTGLALSSTCVLSGTPTVLSSATSYTITATNTGGSGSAAVSIAVGSSPSLGYAGTPYTFTVGTSVGTITPTNSGSAIVSCSVNPSLPAGLSFSATTCVISGTPTAISGTATYTVTATNSLGSSPINISITVVNKPVLSYPSAPFVFTAGTSITAQTPMNTGNAATSCSSSPTLPAGLSLSSSCILSGSPTTVTALTSYTISGTNSVGTGTVAINITVNAAAPNIAYAGSPYNFPTGTAITSKTPSNTGGAIVSCAVAPALPTGLALSSACVLSGTPTVVTVATNYTITATNTGGSSNAAITLSIGSLPALAYAGSPYSFTVGTSVGTLTPTNSGSPVISCSASPSLPAGLSLSATCVLSGTPTVISASNNYSITATNSIGNSSVSIAITVNNKPVLTYSGSPFVFTSGTAIVSQTPGNSGGEATSCSSAPALPAGLALSSGCILSGTPTATSTATNYTFSGTNTSGTGTVVISIAVHPVTPSISYAGSPYAFTKSVAITAQTPSNTGGTITSCSSSPTLPAGLAISATCVISGTPTAITASTSYTITATNAGGTGTAAIVISVNAAPVLTYAGSPYSYTKGTAIATITPTNTGGAPTSCTISPDLPGGLSMTSACVLSGTPTVASPSTIYTITAGNSAGTQNVTITITVLGPPIISYSGSPFTFKQNTAIGPVAPTNTGSPATSCSSSPTLPSGLALSAACVLSGTPTALTSGTYTITGTNSKGGGTASISITVTLTGFILRANALIASDALVLFYSSTHPWTISQTGSGLSEVTTDLSADGVNYDLPPVYSPDGSKVAFAVNSGSYNIWIMNSDGSGKTALTQNTLPGEDSINPVFSPDGSTLYFQSRAAVEGFASQSFNIWKVDVTGQGLMPLTSQIAAGMDSTEPEVSRDGKSLVFTSLMTTSGAPSASTNIWIMDSSGGSLIPLTSNESALLNSKDPSFSADGSAVLFASQQAQVGSAFNIWSMQSDGTSQQQLTQSAGADCTSPRESPDGKSIVFVSRMNIENVISNSSNIWEMNSDGTSLRYLTGNTESGLDSFLAPGSIWVQSP